MNLMYDTSTLLALYVEAHPDHEKAVNTHIQLSKEESETYICAHSIAELYANLTRGIAYFNFSAMKAESLINTILDKFFSVVELTRKDYIETIEFLKEEKLTGAVIYDGIIVQAASKIDAEYIVTFNEKDFKRLGGLVNADFIIPT